MNQAENLHFKRAYLDNGWVDNVRISVSDSGLIDRVDVNTQAELCDRQMGSAIPGIPNIHSHAFQRVMSGLSEYKRAEKDTFWSWRDLMYRFANEVGPESLNTIAAQLYIEMVKSGYTGVAEFHYLHHQRGGEEYERIETLSAAIIDGAELAGINLTLLPVLYMSAGFGGVPLSNEQLRFANDIDGYLRLLDAALGSTNASAKASLGMAFHSLRAVAPEAMEPILRGFDQIAPDGPIHVHISEQVKEVNDCIAWSGKRPVEWLLDHHDVNARWCLVHATHLNDSEIIRLANSGAVVGLCPTTEANLGDGVFPLSPFIEAGGEIAIGSDSNSSVSPIEELRWLEYGQRLSLHSRNVAATKNYTHTGDSLFERCLSGGAKALGRKTAKLKPGYQADILVLDENVSNFAHTPSEFALDALVFSGNQRVIKDVMVSGTWQVLDYKHRNEENVQLRFLDLMASMRLGGF